MKNIVKIQKTLKKNKSKRQKGEKMIKSIHKTNGKKFDNKNIDEIILKDCELVFKEKKPIVFLADTYYTYNFTSIGTKKYL